MKMSQAITWNEYDTSDWRVYDSPGLNRSIECIMKLWSILWLFISSLKSVWVLFVPKSQMKTPVKIHSDKVYSYSSLWCCQVFCVVSFVAFTISSEKYDIRGVLGQK